MKKPVHLPSKSFPSLREAVDYFRDIHDKHYAPYAVISGAEHDQVLRELVATHPAADEKVGPGIQEFFVGFTSDSGREFVTAEQTGIWIRDVEGDVRDFSYNTALKQPEQAAVVRDALRNAVADKRIAFREAAFAGGATVTCPETGAVLTAWNQAAVVYRDPKWVALTAQFAEQNGGWSALDTHRGYGGVQVGNLLSSKSISDAWIEFWSTNANPTIVAKPAAPRPAGSSGA